MICLDCDWKNRNELRHKLHMHIMGILYLRADNRALEIWLYHPLVLVEYLVRIDQNGIQDTSLQSSIRNGRSVVRAHQAWSGDKISNWFKGVKARVDLRKTDGQVSGRHAIRVVMFLDPIKVLFVT